MSDEFDEYGIQKHWDEFDWEKFMEEQDEEASRLARFMEEHKDDPDSDSLMARETGWPADSIDNPDETSDPYVDDFEDEGEEWKFAAGFESQNDAEGGLPDFRSDLLYLKALDFAIDSASLYEQLPESLRTDQEIQEAFLLALIPAAKAANAWDDGNDDMDMLGYRIAAYKRGLAAANRSLELLGSIRRKKLLDDQHLLTLITLGIEMRNAIAIRVLEVRRRFDEG